MYIVPSVINALSDLNTHESSFPGNISPTSATAAAAAAVAAVAKGLTRRASFVRESVANTSRDSVEAMTSVDLLVFNRQRVLCFIREWRSVVGKSLVENKRRLQPCFQRLSDQILFCFNFNC